MPQPSISQPSGLPGRRTATSIPTATVGNKAISRTNWGAVLPSHATSTRAAMLSAKASTPSAMADRGESSRRTVCTALARPSMRVTLPAERSGIVTGQG